MKINVNNEQKYELVDGKFEFKRIPLEDHQSNFIYIPMSVITDTSLDLRRVGIYSYLKMHQGLNNVVNLTIPDIVEWCGGKPDRRAGGTNDKFLYTLDCFNDEGYLSYLTERSRSSYMKCLIDKKHCYSQCSNAYSVVYIDEVNAIMNYEKENARDNVVSNFIILLVFAYLRHKIRRRPNKLKEEERSSEGIKNRRKRMPDAYNDNISDMANEIGISSKTLSRIINILECDLHLIVTDSAYRVKNEDNEFRTLPTIFANAYKREDKYLLDAGDNYSRNEIELKAEQIRKYYKDYQINKSKRK